MNFTGLLQSLQLQCISALDFYFVPVFVCWNEVIISHLPRGRLLFSPTKFSTKSQQTKIKLFFFSWFQSVVLFSLSFS